MDKPVPVPPAHKPRRRLRWVLAILGGLVLCLVGFYFIATSSGFLKAVVLPRLGRALNAQVTADTVGLSPFSQLEVRGLKLQPTGAEPLLQADEVLARYSLRSILAGHIQVDEIKLVAPRIQLVRKADGTSNLDPLLKAFSQGSPSKASAKPTQLALRQIELSQGKLHWEQTSPNGDRQSADANNFNLSIDQVQNGQTSKLTLAGGIQCQLLPAKPSAGATNSLLAANLSANYTFKLGADLSPQGLTGGTRVEVTQAQGDWREAASLAAVLDAEVNPTTIEKLNVQFQRGATPLGQIRVSGPYDTAKSEGRFKVEIAGIDHQVLNLLGAPYGLDFGATTLNTSNQVELAQQGKLIIANGRLSAGQLSVREKQLAVPPVDLVSDYDVSVDLAAQNALVRQLAMEGRQATNQVLRAALDKPMRIAWGKAAQAIEESAFQFAITNLNLADWGGLLATNAPTGRFSLGGRIVALKGGGRLSVELDSTLRDLSLRLGERPLALALLNLHTQGQLEDFEKLNLDSCRWQIADQNQTLASGDAAVNYDLKSGDYRVKANLDAAVAGLLQKCPATNITSQSGALTLAGSAARQGQKQSVTAKLALTNFTGLCFNLPFQQYQAQLDCDLALNGPQLQIHQASLTVASNVIAGGSLTLAGAYDLNQNAGQLAFTVTGLNQAGLAPVAPLLAPRAVSSVSLNSTGSVSLNSKDQSNLKAELNVANLIVKDPAGAWPAAPLNLQLQVDGGWNVNQQLNLNQLAVDLLEATTPSGQLKLAGNLNLTNRTGQATFQIVNVTQAALAPWLGPFLAPRSLASISLNGAGSAALDAQQQGSVKLDLSVTNLVVNDPQKKAAAQPLAARFQLDSALSTQGMDLRQCLLNLPATARATNQVQLAGHLQWPTNVVSGQLDLQADAVDLAPVLDWLGANNATNAPAKAAAPATSTTAGPAPVPLPIQELAAQLKIGRFHYGELVITNWQAALKIKGSEITLDPFQLAVNGAPAKASAVCNLGVPGYTYNVGLQADHLALEPLVNTLAPARRGQYKGDITLQAQLKGAGLTGADLQTNLTGQFAFTLTNANVELLGPTATLLMTPVAAALQLPELLQSPLDAFDARASVGQGQVKVEDFTAFSPVFVVSGQGAMALSAVLSNSTLNLPVTLALHPTLAAKARLINASNASGSNYAVLPSFMKIGGTLGNPKTQLNPSGLAQVGLQSIIGFTGGSGTKVGSALQGVESLLGGNSSTATNRIFGAAPGLNQPTNAGVSSLLNLLPKSATNASPFSSLLSNLPAAKSATNAPSLNSLLSILPGARAATNPPVGGLTNTGQFTNLYQLTNRALLQNRLSNLATNTNAVPPATNRPATQPLDLLRNLLGK